MLRALEATTPGVLPWRQRPRGSLARTSAHLILAPALITLIGPVLVVEGVGGSRAWPTRILMLVGGLLIIAAAVLYWTFIRLYIERPYDPTLDR